MGKSIQVLQNDTLSYHDYSVSGLSSQQFSGINLKLLCLFPSILLHYKKKKKKKKKNLRRSRLST